MKLALVLIISGSGYLLFRISYAICIMLYSTLKDPSFSASYMITQGIIIGGLLLFFGIRRLRKVRRTKYESQTS